MRVSLPRVHRKFIDTLLEYLRFRKAKKHIAKGSTLLDIGTGDGAFLRYLKCHIRFGVGIDPLIRESVEMDHYEFLPGMFPDDFFMVKQFDVITALAVVEHIPEERLLSFADVCWMYLVSGGRVIITVPHPVVDRILDIMKRVRLIKGMALEEHYGFDPNNLPSIFSRWRIVKKERWELGLNFLYVFEKCDL